MVNRAASLLMLFALVFAGIGGLMPRSTRAQTTLRGELERTSLVDQNSRSIARQSEQITALRDRVAYMESLHIEARIALLEAYVNTTVENQKLLWGMLFTMAFFVVKEIYAAFSKKKRAEL